MSGELAELDSAVAGFESTATNYAFRFIPDARVRLDYQKQIKAMSNEIYERVSSGKLSASQGARQASDLRNIVMDSMRGRSSEIAQAYAVKMKANGYSLSQLESKYSKKLFNKSFQSLNHFQKNQVWKEVVVSAGRASPTAKQGR